MEQTKITIKIWEKLLDRFNENLDASFIKRDAYLNHILKTEATYLKREMSGLELSPEARRYIANELKLLGTKTINVTVDKETAENLNAIVNKSNMVRDAFINRLILFLTLEDKQLQAVLQLDTLRESSTYYDEPQPLGPAESLKNSRDDPFNYIRSAVEEKGEDLYLTKLKKSQFSNAMTCYFRDSDVPGTEAYRTSQIEAKKFLDDFLSIDITDMDIKDLPDE